MGEISYGPTENEEPSLQYRCSLYVAQDMKTREIFTKENLSAIRPGLGLPPKYFDMVVGGRVNQDVQKGTAVKWEILK
ncbi:MAG: hypothetical protein A2W23_03260 [Planctomycetes bacterium RBG_16_43_13]|nr:MAG: hypothetical protein A2W23_03260 [Planctomycetes bacterium RBG_16_43_13]